MLGRFMDVFAPAPLMSAKNNEKLAGKPTESGLQSSLNFGNLARKSASGADDATSKRSKVKETKKGKRSRAGSRVSRDFSSSKKSKLMSQA